MIAFLLGDVVELTNCWFQEIVGLLHPCFVLVACSECCFSLGENSSQQIASG